MGPQRLWRASAFALLILVMFLSARYLGAQRTPTADAVTTTAVECQGPTRGGQAKPPLANPADLSQGFGLRAPGEAATHAQKAPVLSGNMPTPEVVTVPQGATVTLNAFVVHGDHREVVMSAPDGQVVLPVATWHQGRQYRMSFVADKVGIYRLNCVTEAPAMTAAILVVPK